MSEFHHLIEEQIPRLRRYARALTHNRTRADDLVQDTLVRALAKEHLWQSGTNLRAWPFTVMHNQHVNTVRQDVRDDAAVDFEDVSATMIATTDPTVSSQLRELDRLEVSACRITGETWDASLSKVEPRQQFALSAETLFI